MQKENQHMAKKSASKSEEAAPQGMHDFCGFPWKGAPQFIDKAAHPDFQPKIVPEAKVKVLRTDKPEDLDALTAILQKQANGHCQITASDRQYDQLGFWRIFITYSEFYAVASSEASKG